MSCRDGEPPVEQASTGADGLAQALPRGATASDIRNEVSGSGSAVVQAGTIAGDVVLHTPVAVPRRVPRELPPVVAGFTGRDREHAELDALLAYPASATAVVISALSGTPGVGKTALAIHWAHSVRDRFPDGDLYIDLQGYAPEQPVAATEALARFLRSLEGGNAVIPPSTAERATRFRTLLNRRRMLIVLDNARTADQVRPLLPGTPTSFVLITSRDDLRGLVISNGARRMVLAALPPAEASALLRTLVGGRADAHPDAAEALVDQCARLPLVLRVAAELVNALPTTPLPELVDQLADEQRRLRMLDEAADDRTAVSAVFRWSYRLLPELAARLFRLLCLQPGDDVDSSVVAALLNTSLDDGRNALGLLVRAHLVELLTSDRAGMHDLLRAYAAHLSELHDTSADRNAALLRLFDHHLYRARQTLEVIAPQTCGQWTVASASPVPPPPFTNVNEALSWWNTGRSGLLALAERAAATIPDTVPRRLMIMHHMLGVAAQHTNDLPVALDHFEAASRWAGDTDPSYRNRIQLDQIDALLSAGLSEEARFYLDEVMPELSRQPVRTQLARSEHSRAIASVLIGDLSLAGKLAVSAARRFRKAGDHRSAALATLTVVRARAMAALADNACPPSLLKRVVNLADELASGALEGEASVARLMAVRLLVRRGHVDAADRQLAAVPVPNEATPVDHRMLLRLARAELAAAHGDRRGALRQAEDGLTELGEVCDRVGGPDVVAGTAVYGRELGELAIRVLVEQPDMNAAQLFTWAERIRAQLYRYRPLPPADISPMADKPREYRRLSRTVHDTTARDGSPGPTLLSQLGELRHEASRLRWAAGSWDKPLPIAGLAKLGDRLGDRVLISYVPAGPDLLAVTIAGGQAQLVRLGSAADADSTAKELHADVDALSPDHQSTPLFDVISTSARTRAYRLDEQLMRPLAWLIGDREVVIVPSGALYAVPWGALPSLAGRAVSVAPSATAWLAALYPTGSGSPESCMAGRTVLVSGGPDLSTSLAETGELLTHHPGAEVLNGQHATVREVLTALDGAELAHLAAHGQHEPGNALFSRLELADGPLYAHETVRLRRPPRHVVLAACELALSRIRPGDEALGFAGVLLAAGTRSVTAAVSRVGDQAAAAAMADYHRRLAAGIPPAMALAETVAVDPLRRPFICLGAGS